jgi:hypothetical protein
MDLQDTDSPELDVTKRVNAMVDRLIKRRIIEAAAVICPDEHPTFIIGALNDVWNKADEIRAKL